MKRRLRPRDTIVRWIALTIALAMLVSLALNALFIEVAGVWAKPPLTQTGLLEQVAGVVRVIEAAPGELRPRLADAAGNLLFAVEWQARRDAIATPAADDPVFHDGTRTMRRLLGDPQRRVEAFEPDDFPDGSSARRYLMLVQLQDASWLAFTTPARSWGLNATARALVIIGLALIAALSVAAIATRRLATPLLSFAKAARRFGGDFHAPPIEAVGPHEIRQAILAFNAMQAQIRHFVVDRTQMLAAISHDLRAPLTRMRLRGEFIDDPEQQHKLFRDVDEMQAMINAALDFFRDDARLEQATPFDLSELLLTLVDDYRDQGIEVAFSGPSGLVYRGRPLGLKRALTNLLENAVKYAREPSIDLQALPGRLLIRIEDRGPGIAEQQLEAVFAPFYRLEASRNKATGGVGLGLSAARAIIREHGGELRLRNRAGGGLRACVELQT